MKTDKKNVWLPFFPRLRRDNINIIEHWLWLYQHGNIVDQKGDTKMQFKKSKSKISIYLTQKGGEEKL